ncbi:MAG: transporter substrate-binding domain-containing protein [Bdellovibrionales bacterium]
MRKCALVLMSGCLFICAGLTACHYPKDPRDTTQTVMKRGLRAGISESPPWTNVEKRLLEKFARELGVQVHWVHGSESQLFESLDHFLLDVVIAGITKNTPYKEKVGITIPYHKMRVVVGGRPEVFPPPKSLKKARIAVSYPDPVRAELERKGAEPVELENPFMFNGLIAAPVFELEARGMKTSNVELANKEFVMAVPPGENGWLMRLEEFLRAHKSEVHQMLIEEVKPR